MTESHLCAQCGRVLPVDGQFCSNCGAARSSAAPPPSPPPPSGRVMPSNVRMFDLFDTNQVSTGNPWIDFLMFRRMVIPTLIRVLFIIALVVCAVGFLVSLFTANWGSALAFVFIGPLVARIYAELIILLFVINDTLADIRKAITDVRDIERTRAA